MKDALALDLPLRDGLRRVYDAAMALYLPGHSRARGCFMIGTAVTEAALDDEIRRNLAEGLDEIDDAFEARLREAKRHGEIPKTANPAALAKLASAALYSLAIRSRTGASRAMLESIIGAALDAICGPRKKR